MHEGRGEVQKKWEENTGEGESEQLQYLPMTMWKMTIVSTFKIMI